MVSINVYIKYAELGHSEEEWKKKIESVVGKAVLNGYKVANNERNLFLVVTAKITDSEELEKFVKFLQELKDMLVFGEII